MPYNIENKTVSTDAVFNFNPPALQGYWAEGPGNASTNMSSNASVLYEGSDWTRILWQNSSDVLELGIEGHVNDSTTDNLEGWDQMVIDGNVFNRSDASITTSFGANNNLYKIKTIWTWTNVSTSPFGATGRNVAVTWRHSGVLPTTGAIHLQHMRSESGIGGVPASMDNASIRALSWSKRVTGVTPASGSTQDFADYYYPRLFGANQSATTYPTRIVMNGESTDYNDIKCGLVEGSYARNGASTSYDGSVRGGIAVQADGTHTYVYIFLGTQGTFDTINRDVFDWGGNTRSASGTLTEVYRIPNVSCTRFSMASSLIAQTVSNEAVLFQNEDPTTTANGNSGPSWTNAANVSANSITTMNAFASTTARYGRQFRIRTQTTDDGIFPSNVRVHFHIRLRRDPVSTAGYWDRDLLFNLKIDQEVDNT